MTDDFYDLLGVERDATQEEIRRAFRQQVRRYHPDLNDDPRAPAQFTALKKAYDTLGDPEERKDYERMGHDDYVRKRINGLPSPDQWRVPGGNGDAGGGDSTGTGTGTGGAATAASSAATDDASGRTGPGPNGSAPGGSRSRSRSRSGAGSASGSTTPGAGAGSRSARSRTASSGTGTGTGTASSPSRGASSGSTPPGMPTGGAAGRKRSTGTTEVGGLRRHVGWLDRASLGWPLIVLTDLVYLLGLEFYLMSNVDGIGRLLDRVAAGGWNAGAVSAALSSRHGVGTLPEFVRSDVSAGAVLGGLLVLAGAAALPSVYFFVVRETRRNRTPWRPSYLFGVAALAPAAGLILDLLVRTDGLYLELVAYVLVPLAAILGLPASAFLRPRIKRLFRRHWRRLRS